MNLLERIVNPRQVEQRYTLSDVAQWFAYNGISYPAFGGAEDGRERIEASYEAFVARGLKGNGVVFACIAARLLLLSEAEFKYQNLSDRRLFGDPSLLLLEQPARGRTTGELLAAVEVDVSLAGNSFWTVRDYADGGQYLKRLRPDWVDIIYQGEGLDEEVVGYAYWPEGRAATADPIILGVGEVAHVAPIPDPVARSRGMSWLTPIVEEIEADSGFTTHRRTSVDKAAMIPFSITYPDMSPERFQQTIDAFNKAHQGRTNAWAPLHLAGGADTKMLGQSLKDMDYKAVQALGETRIAAAARVPAVVLGISEGLSGSSLNQGNYGMARRQFGDGYLRPTLREIAGAFAPLLDVPTGARLWYDDRYISFLHEDRKDAAEINASDAQSARSLVEAGYEPASVVNYLASGDITLLVHTGKLSVQLQEPGAEPTTTEPASPPADDTGTQG